MLIINKEQQDEMKVVRRQTCAWCKQELDYPRIVADDIHATSYHLPCSLQLMADMTADLSEFMAAPELTEMAKRITVTNFMRQPSRGASMTEAFRVAAQQHLD